MKHVLELTVSNVDHAIIMTLHEIVDKFNKQSLHFPLVENSLSF